MRVKVATFSAASLALTAAVIPASTMARAAPMAVLTYPG
jgi:hypothetical protein